MMTLLGCAGSTDTPSTTAEEPAEPAPTSMPVEPQAAPERAAPTRADQLEPTVGDAQRVDLGDVDAESARGIWRLASGDVVVASYGDDRQLHLVVVDVAQASVAERLSLPVVGHWRADDTVHLVDDGTALTVLAHHRNAWTVHARIAADAVGTTPPRLANRFLTQATPAVLAGDDEGSLFGVGVRDDEAFGLGRGTPDQWTIQWRRALDLNRGAGHARNNGAEERGVRGAASSTRSASTGDVTHSVVGVDICDGRSVAAVQSVRAGAGGAGDAIFVTALGPGGDVLGVHGPYDETTTITTHCHDGVPLLAVVTHTLDYTYRLQTVPMDAGANLGDRFFPRDRIHVHSERARLLSAGRRLWVVDTWRDEVSQGLWMLPLTPGDEGWERGTPRAFDEAHSLAGVPQSTAPCALTELGPACLVLGDDQALDVLIAEAQPASSGTSGQPPRRWSLDILDPVDRTVDTSLDDGVCAHRDWSGVEAAIDAEASCDACTRACGPSGALEGRCSGERRRACCLHESTAFECDELGIDTAVLAGARERGELELDHDGLRVALEVSETSKVGTPSWTVTTWERTALPCRTPFLARALLTFQQDHDRNDEYGDMLRQALSSCWTRNCPKRRQYTTMGCESAQIDTSLEAVIAGEPFTVVVDRGAAEIDVEPDPGGERPWRVTDVRRDAVECGDPEYEQLADLARANAEAVAASTRDENLRRQTAYLIGSDTRERPDCPFPPFPRWWLSAPALEHGPVGDACDAVPRFEFERRGRSWTIVDVHESWGRCD